MRFAKSRPNLWPIWQDFGPWASPYGTNGQMTMPVHSYMPRQFHRTSNGENPSSGYRGKGSASLTRTVTTIPLQRGGPSGKKHVRLLATSQFREIKKMQIYYRIPKKNDRIHVRYFQLNGSNGTPIDSEIVEQICTIAITWLGKVSTYQEHVELTHCGLMRPYGDIHWPRKWLVASRHLAIIWANVDLSSSMAFCDIHIRAISQNCTYELNP